MTDLVRLARARALGSTGEGQRVRLAARITFREMGRRVGVPQSSIVQWESGKTWPSEEAALRWLDAAWQASQQPAPEDVREELAQITQDAEDGDLTKNGWHRKPGPGQFRAADEILAASDVRRKP